MQRIAIRIVLLALLSFTANIHLVKADEVYTFVIKKQEEKKQNRWSLQDWLETRDKMRLMDLWLAMHSPTPYEFFVKGGYQFGTVSGAQDPALQFSAGAYASIIGLEYHQEWGSAPNWEALLGLRLMGFHVQATNLTLHVGLRSRSTEDYRQAVVGGTLSIYLLRFFGIQGNYRYGFASIPSRVGGIWTSNRYEAGAFLDFKALRVYGKYFWLEEKDQSSGSLGRNGSELGLQLFL